MPGEGPQRAGQAEVLDLFLDAAGAAALLVRSVAGGARLDAYLSAVALQQLALDECGAAVTTLRRATRRLDRAGGTLAGAAATFASSVSRCADRTSAGQRKQDLARTLQPLVDELASLTLHPALEGPDLATRAAQVRALVASASAALGSAAIRIPSSFHSFDQHPADMAELAQRLVATHGRECALAVVGVRTSGAYLAPLLAAALRDRTVRTVETFTLRPGWPLGTSERRGLHAIAASGGRVVLVDDPPITGGALASALRQLEREAGVRRSALLLALATFEEDACLSGELAAVESVVLPYSAWDIHRRLAPPAVEALVRAAYRGRDVVAVEVDPAETPGRGHASVRVAVSWRGVDGVTRRDDLVAEGAGIGFFASPARDIPSRAPGLYPTPLAYEDGVLLHAAVTDAARWSAPTRADAPALAAHLARRHAALAVAKDPSAHFVGRQAAHEIATGEAARALGPLADVAAPLLAGPAVRRLLAVRTPVLVDADLWGDRWFRGADGTMGKVAYAEGAFGHHDLASYDPAFDVVGAAVAAGDPAFAAALRAAYGAATGTEIDAVRWALLELVHLWNARRLGKIEALEVARRRSVALARLYGALYLDDVPRPDSGEWCALDVDGVLEGGALGFPAVSEASATALRALRAHGRRVVLASGRSLGELAERCEILALEGAVGEYGAAAYVAATGEQIELLSPQAREAMGALRARIEAEADLACDPAYTRVVRCVETGAGGPRPLRPAAARALLESVGLTARVVVRHGTGQTDFVPRETDKAAGVRALLSRLGVAEQDKPLAFAIGDGVPDAPLLALAQHPFAPAHAAALFADGTVDVTRRSYEAGMAEAVGRYLGHRPGGCATCRRPAITPDTRALIALLSLHEAGRAGLARRGGVFLTLALRAGVRARLHGEARTCG